MNTNRAELIAECERLRHDLARAMNNHAADLAETERLRTSNAALLDLAYQLWGQCELCGGNGFVTIFDYDDQDNGSEEDQPCSGCADIRAVIRDAEAK
jgi:hypothetical protein